jgi:hypothetical protein
MALLRPLALSVIRGSSANGAVHLGRIRRELKIVIEGSPGPAINQFRCNLSPTSSSFLIWSPLLTSPAGHCRTVPTYRLYSFPVPLEVCNQRSQRGDNEGQAPLGCDAASVQAQTCCKYFDMILGLLLTPNK